MSKSKFQYLINICQYTVPPAVIYFMEFARSQDFMDSLDPAVALSLLNILQTAIEPKLEDLRKKYLLPENPTNRIYFKYQSILNNKAQFAKLFSSDMGEIISSVTLGIGLESAYQTVFAMINANASQPKFTKIALDWMLVLTPETITRRLSQRLLPKRANPDLTGPLGSSLVTLLGFYVLNVVAGYDLLSIALPYVSGKVCSAFFNYIKQDQANKRKESQDNFNRRNSYETIPIPKEQAESGGCFQYVSSCWQNFFGAKNKKKTQLVHRI